MWFFKRRNKRSIQDSLIKEIKEESLDMKGLFTNINNRDKVVLLYKELCKLSHPDNNLDKQAIAHELFAKVQRSRNDYNSLLKLKEEIAKSLKNEMG